MKGRGGLLLGLPFVMLAVWAGLQVVEDRAMAAALEAHQRRWNCLVREDATNPACAGVAPSEDADRCPQAVAVCRGQGLYAGADATLERVFLWSRLRALLLGASLLASVALLSSWSWRGLRRRRALRAGPVTTR